MSRGVDVLVVLDIAAARCDSPARADALREARAAVAELVEAAALLADRTERNIRSCGEIDMDNGAAQRVRAALAAFGDAA